MGVSRGHSEWTSLHVFQPLGYVFFLALVSISLIVQVDDTFCHIDMYPYGLIPDDLAAWDEHSLALQYLQDDILLGIFPRGIL